MHLNDHSDIMVSISDSLCMILIFIGDRQARIAAAELLHGVITFMVGSAASAPKDRTGGSKFAPMYSLVLPAALQLSVSTDSVCRQLFHTLLFQIVRWFAGTSNVQEAESSALLDCLVVGLCNPSDTRLRNQVRCVVVLHRAVLYFLSVVEYIWN
jgi:hypothetical protein